MIAFSLKSARHGLPSIRQTRFQNLADGEPLDALVVGGGVTGAAIYSELCRRGYRTAVIDAGDFASGTSQASGMMIWGGLLYLKNLDFATVIKLCRARREMMAEFRAAVGVLNLRYLPSEGSPARQLFLRLGLQLYWLLGGCSLRRPSSGGFSPGNERPGLAFQEGMLRESDSRFVLDLIRTFQSEHCIALNYCRLTAAEFSADQRCWSVMVRDERTGTAHSTKARLMINAAGIWTDEVNRVLGIESPYKHVLSKGVYLAFPRAKGQTEARVYPMEGVDDVLTHVPWGPVSLWGPTEAAVRDIETGLKPSREDIRFLLKSANRSLPQKVGPEDIVSVRCGIRPLAVPRSYNREDYPLALSRGHRVVVNQRRRAISLYGGKFTSSIRMARQTAAIVEHWAEPKFSRPPEFQEHPRLIFHEELRTSMVSPDWARDHELCVTLEDYLRRRTPIAQWVPRMGLDRDGSGRESLLELAAAFASEEPAEAIVAAYERRVRESYDPLTNINP